MADVPILFRGSAWSAYYFVYVIIFLFLLGTMYIIFNQVATNNIYEPFTLNGLNASSFNGSTTTMYNFSQEDLDYASEWMNIWALVPFFLVIAVVWFGIQRTVVGKD